MHLAESAKRYQANAVTTAPPGRLVLMLFDGALRFMAAASTGFQMPVSSLRFETIHNNLVKAQDILRELQTALNLEQGGEFSERMFALYDYMISQLAQANFQKEASPIGVVEKMLGEIRDAWAEMLTQAPT